MERKTWTARDDERLRSLYAELVPLGRIDEVAELMGRSKSSVNHRASRLGIGDLRHPRPRGVNNPQWQGGPKASLRKEAEKLAQARAERGASKQRAWSPEEDAMLTASCQTMIVPDICVAMGRSRGSIRAAMRRLNLRGQGTAWQRRGEFNHNWRGGSRASHRRVKYKLEPADYDLLLTSQNGGCAICGNNGTNTARGLHIDHDHTTGATRGILCMKCNLMLGKAGDSIEVLLAAVDYLRCHVGLSEVA